MRPPPPHRAGASRTASPNPAPPLPAPASSRPTRPRRRRDTPKCQPPRVARRPGRGPPPPGPGPRGPKAVTRPAWGDPVSPPAGRGRRPEPALVPGRGCRPPSPPGGGRVERTAPMDRARDRVEAHPCIRPQPGVGAGEAGRDGDGRAKHLPLGLVVGNEQPTAVGGRHPPSRIGPEARPACSNTRSPSKSAGRPTANGTANRVGPRVCPAAIDPPSSAAAAKHRAEATSGSGERTGPPPEWRRLERPRHARPRPGARGTTGPPRGPDRRRPLRPDPPARPTGNTRRRRFGRRSW